MQLLTRYEVYCVAQAEQILPNSLTRFVIMFDPPRCYLIRLWRNDNQTNYGCHLKPAIVPLVGNPLLSGRFRRKDPTQQRGGSGHSVTRDTRYEIFSRRGIIQQWRPTWRPATAVGNVDEEGKLLAAHSSERPRFLLRVLLK